MKKNYILSDLVKIKYGKNQSKVVDENGEYPILGTGGLMGYANQYLYNRPSVLIGRKGSIKNVKYIDKPFWTVDTLFYTIINEELVIPKYLFYKLSKYDLSVYNEGSAVPSLTVATLNQISVDVPSLVEQKRIADILTSLDEKIELNNQMDQTLEEMAKVLYKQWFVDFEFPNEDGKPYKSSGGEMVESELGLIPKGWENGKISDLANDIITGKTPSTRDSENFGCGIPFITIPDMKNNTFIYSTERAITEKAQKGLIKKILPQNTIVVSCIATPGIVSITTEESITNQQINAVLCEEENLYYLFNVLEELSEHIKMLGSGGSTTLNLNKSVFKDITIQIPPNELRIMFHSKINKLYEMIKNNLQENIVLENIKTTALMSLI